MEEKVFSVETSQQTKIACSRELAEINSVKVFCVCGWVEALNSNRLIDGYVCVN